MRKNPNILRSIIMDHYEHPRNKNLVEDNEYKLKHMASHSCVDDIKVQLKLKGNVIEDIRFDGVGCTISTASMSIMVEILMGKTIQEAKYIIEQYQNMLLSKPFDEDVLQEAICMEGVSKQPNRINCATLGTNGITAILNEIKEEQWKEK